MRISRRFRLLALVIIFALSKSVHCANEDTQLVSAATAPDSAVSGPEESGGKPVLTSTTFKEFEEIEEKVENVAGVSNNVAQLVSLCCFLLMSACVLQFVISKVNDKIPISIACFLFGMATYETYIAMKRYKLPDPLTQAISGLRKIDSSILYYVALPILLYEATQDIDWYKFCNFIFGGIGLAVVGVVLQVLILGCVFYYLLNLPLGGTLTANFLLASILSSTDPIAVLSILSGVNARDKLSVIFNGESLINDGSSVFLFQFFYLALGHTKSYGYYTLLFFKLLILGPLLGIVFAIVVIFWISLYRKHHMSQCLAVMTCGYIAYFVAEYSFNLSGPLAIVCYGLFIKGYGVFAFDREALEKHHNLMEGLCLISNSAVFIISGVVTAGMLRTRFEASEIWWHIGKLFMCYLFLNVARAIMIGAFSPLLSYIGYGINIKEATILVWGGLRGAIVLVLGLRLERAADIDDRLSDVLGFYISGSVMLILLIQGFTFELLYRWLNPYPMNPFRQVYLSKVMHMIDYSFSHEVKWLNTHWLFKGTQVIKYASKLIPIMSRVKWTRMGNLVHELPDIHSILSNIPLEHLYYKENAKPSQKTNEDSTPVSMLQLPKRCSTLVSCISVVSEEEKEDEQAHDVEDGNAPDDDADAEEECVDVATHRSLLTSNIERTTLVTESRFNPKIYLRLLEHATSATESDADVESFGPSHRHLGPEAIGIAQAVASTPPPKPPERTDTDATINIEALFTKPIHWQVKDPSSLRHIDSSDSLYKVGLSDDVIDDIEGNGDDYEDCNVFESRNGSNASNAGSAGGTSGHKKVLRKEREGELFIMIFNAFSHLYKRLYQSALVDGGSLLMLQSSLDIAAEFALKKLKRRSIAAWEQVLSGHVHSRNFGGGGNGDGDGDGDSYPDNIQAMDGFEFEWFVLVSIIEGNTNSFGQRIGRYFTHFSQHSRVLSLLEMLTAFIEVHVQILNLGGRNLTRLLNDKLLQSYKLQIERATQYVWVLQRRWPRQFALGLINMAACMMIRIKKDIVHDQSILGLLLDDDRQQILQMLDDQLYAIATHRDYVSVFKTRVLRLWCRKKAND